MSLKQSKKDNRLFPKYYGPYKVLQNIGTMTYKLELLASLRLHPVFHVSCLKKVIGDKLPNLPIEDSTWEDENFIKKHLELLKH